MSDRLPTNASDPEPGDFDAELADIDPRNVHRSSGNPGARLSLGVTVHGDDADKLRQIAHMRGQRPSDVVADIYGTAWGRVLDGVDPAVLVVSDTPSIEIPEGIPNVE